MKWAVAKGGIVGLALFAFSFASVVADNPFSGGDVEKAQAQQQTGLINVNLTDLNLQIPVSVAVPVSVAANVCGVNVLDPGPEPTGSRGSSRAH